MRSLRDRTAVITGAASGIGRALADRLSREGMRLVLADVSRAGLRRLASAFPDALTVRTDVARSADVEALADAAFRRFGAVHLLINNAGIVEYGPLWEIPLARWKRVVGVNLWGAIHGCLAFVPRMLAQGSPAHIVNTASMAGLVTPPASATYSVTKHGVVALSEALVQDLAGQGARIGVSVLCPGWVATRLIDSSRTPDPAIASLIAGGLSPEAVADRTVRAIRAGEFYVLTHPELAGTIRRRADDIVSGRAPATGLRLQRWRATSR